MPDPRRTPGDEALEALAAIYETAERQLRRLVRDAAGRGADGTAAYFARQRAQARRVVAELRARSLHRVPAAVEAAYVPGAYAAAAVLGREFGFSGVHRAAIEVLAEGLVDRLDGATRTVGRRVDDAIRRASLEEVATGLVRGDARRATSARLRDRLADEGLTCFVDSAGRRWRLEAYARMVTRTTSREAQSAGTLNSMELADEDLVAISKHLGSCEICVPFEGRTYSRSGRDPRYPRLVRLCPLHPNCRHVMHPAAASLEDFERELGLAPRAPVPV